MRPTPCPSHTLPVHTGPVCSRVGCVGRLWGVCNAQGVPCTRMHVSVCATHRMDVYTCTVRCGWKSALRLWVHALPEARRAPVPRLCVWGGGDRTDWGTAWRVCVSSTGSTCTQACVRCRMRCSCRFALHLGVYLLSLGVCTMLSGVYLAPDVFPGLLLLCPHCDWPLQACHGINTHLATPPPSPARLSHDGLNTRLACLAGSHSTPSSPGDILTLGPLQAPCPPPALPPGA
jgi:hypothetical protein